jgi:hypothetical protein
MADPFNIIGTVIAVGMLARDMILVWQDVGNIATEIGMYSAGLMAAVLGLSLRVVGSRQDVSNPHTAAESVLIKWQRSYCRLFGHSRIPSKLSKAVSVSLSLVNCLGKSLQTSRRI